MTWFLDRCTVDLDDGYGHRGRFGSRRARLCPLALPAVAPQEFALPLSLSKSLVRTHSRKLRLRFIMV